MKSILYFFLSSLFFFNNLQAQQNKQADTLLLLSKSSQQKLRRMPYLRLPAYYKGTNAPELPAVIDNSTLPFFRPVFSQNGASCGQAASIGYAFTYEINRVRGLSSNCDLTQYPPHFTWNWENGGYGYYGVSYYHSFDVLKDVGTPNTYTYGGFYGPYGYDEEYNKKYWMSGYDKYYQAMKNRISESYSIDLSTPEGIKTLKYWLFDHLDGSHYGGVANFYSCPPPTNNVLPEGTPEEGKHITTYWGSPTHAMTICGYNDSIRWDYNGDGLYTNDIDITGDGKVDVRDWEIGGFKVANSYGDTYLDDGFFYLTYKSCTDSILVDGIYKNGIWNSAANIVMVKEDTQPLLTAKIALKHDGRGRLRVRMGCATDINATEPEFIILFPIFNFQGGNYKYMQGGESEEDKAIEFGLDITPLLNMIPKGEEAKFFLLVDENDPNNVASGEIINFSIIDYTKGVDEHTCLQSHIPIENGTTSLWVNHTVNYNEVEILTDVLKGAIPGQAYYSRIDAAGGQPPYHFTMDTDYTESTDSQEFEAFDGLNYEGDTIVQELEFNFPFYGKNYSQLTISRNGYLFFDNFIVDDYSHFYQLFQENKVIAPYLLSIDTNGIINDEMWYKANAESAAFRWKSHLKTEPSSVLNFSARLFKSGEIEFSYGDMSFETTQWIAGISSGKNKQYQYTDNSSFATIPTNSQHRFKPVVALDSLQLSQDGILSGIFKEDYVNKNIKIKVEDVSNLEQSKTLSFSSEPYSLLQLKEFLTLNPSDTALITNGDTVAVSFKVENKGQSSEHGVRLRVQTNNPYITIENEEILLGDFELGEEKYFEASLRFIVAKSIPESFRFEIKTSIESQEGEKWDKSFFFRANSPKVISLLAAVSYGEELNPGETADVLFLIKNIGVSLVQDIYIKASSISPDIILNSTDAFLDSLPPEEVRQVSFSLSVKEHVAKGSVFPIFLKLNDNKGYQTNLQFIVAAGNIIEDFESGDLSQFNWTIDSSNMGSWSISSENVYEGDYALQSKTIAKSISLLSLKENFISSGNLHFTYYCDNPYDQLIVYNSGNQQTYFSDKEWLTGNIPISHGKQEIKWICNNPYSSKHTILDNISFPPTAAVNPIFSFSPTHIQDSLFGDSYYENTIEFKNLGKGNIYFSTLIVDSLDRLVDWVKISPKKGKIARGESFYSNISLDPQELKLGDSKAILRIFDHNGKSFDIPLQFNHKYLERKTCNEFEITSFPNPFKDRLRVDFKIKEKQTIGVQIFDLQGRMINSINLGAKEAGANYFYWKGDNSTGIQVPTGIYYLNITSDKSSCTQKLIKIK